MKVDYKQLFLDFHNARVDIDEYKGGYDFEMTEEYTADGYSIYLCRYYNEAIVLEENVYYYTHELTDKLKELIEDGNYIYIAESIYDENSMDEEWVNWCEDEGLIEWDDDRGWYKVVGEEDEEDCGCNNTK
tara:strand:+ start:137 stop:529 length:393 start_codon:yes stop_codon:yes gene_type:complete